MQPLLARYRTVSPAYYSQGVADGLPKPHGKAQVIGYALLGIVLLAAIFVIAIKLQRRD